MLPPMGRRHDLQGLHAVGNDNGCPSKGPQGRTRGAGQPFFAKLFGVVLPGFINLSSRSVINADIVNHREAQTGAKRGIAEIHIVKMKPIKRDLIKRDLGKDGAASGHEYSVDGLNVPYDRIRRAKNVDNNFVLLKSIGYLAEDVGRTGKGPAGMLK